MRTFIGLTMAVGILVSCLLLATGPVLVESYLMADLFGSISDAPVIVLNPMRDRTPELAADKFLAQLGRGDARTALAGVCANGEEFERLADRETQYPLRAWDCYTRRDSGSETVLTIWPVRGNYGAATAPPAIVQLQRTGDDYRVVRYAAAY